jgi:hypothetical protein
MDAPTLYHWHISEHGADDLQAVGSEFWWALVVQEAKASNFFNHDLPILGQVLSEAGPKCRGGDK